MSKKAWRVTLNSVGSNTIVGIGTWRAPLSSYVGADQYGWAMRGDGKKVHGGSASDFGNSLSNNDVVDIVLELETGKLWFAVNGVWQDNGQPSTGENPAFEGVFGTFYLMWSPNLTSEQATIEFDGVEWTHLKAYLCCVDAADMAMWINAKWFNDQISISETDEDYVRPATHLISAPMELNDGKPVTHMITTKLAEKFSDVLPYRTCWGAVDDETWIERQKAYSYHSPDPEVEGDIDVWRPHPSLLADLPFHCQWIRSDIKKVSTTLAQTETVHVSYIPGGGGAIGDGEKATARSTPSLLDLIQPQLQIVPGQHLRLWEDYLDGTTTWSLVASETWFRTAGFFGGLVTYVYLTKGQEGKYTVYAGGKYITVWSSDRVEYAVGDWVFLTPIPAQECEDRPGMTVSRTPTDPNESNSEVFNAWRAERGLPPLVYDPSLQAAAQGNADEMALYDFLDIIGSDGSTPDSRVAETGYGDGQGFEIAENIASEYDSLEAALAGWEEDRNHPGNNENMRSQDWVSVGFAVAEADDGTKYYSLVMGYNNLNREGKPEYCIVPFKMNSIGA